jgi:hypothetical protein
MGSDAMVHGSISELSTMPAMVQKATCAGDRTTSALPPRTDIGDGGCDVCFVPKSGLVRRSKLSDYPISSSASESGSAEVAMHYAFATCD